MSAVGTPAFGDHHEPVSSSCSRRASSSSDSICIWSAICGTQPQDAAASALITRTTERDARPAPPLHHLFLLPTSSARACVRGPHPSLSPPHPFSSAPRLCRPRCTRRAPRPLASPPPFRLIWFAWSVCDGCDHFLMVVTSPKKAPFKLEFVPRTFANRESRGPGWARGHARRPGGARGEGAGAPQAARATKAAELDTGGAGCAGQRGGPSAARLAVSRARCALAASGVPGRGAERRKLQDDASGRDRPDGDRVPATARQSEPGRALLQGGLRVLPPPPRAPRLLLPCGGCVRHA